MDVRVGDGGSESKVVCLRCGLFGLEEGKEIVCSLAEVCIVSHFWEGDCVWEPVKCEGVASGVGVGDQSLVTAIVFEGWADVETFASMGCECSTLFRCFEGENSGAWDGHWCFVEVEGAVDACMCG